MEEEQQEQQLTEIIEHQKTHIDILGLMEQTWEILKKVLYILSYSYVVCILILVCILIMQHTGHISTETLAKFPCGFHPSVFFDDSNSDGADYFYGFLSIMAWIAVGTRVMGKEILGGLLGIFLIVSLFIPKLLCVWLILGLLLSAALIIMFFSAFIKGGNANSFSGLIAYLVLGVRAVIYILTGKQ